MSLQAQFRARSPAISPKAGLSNRSIHFEAPPLPSASVLRSEVPRTRDLPVRRGLQHQLVGGRSKRAVDVALSLVLLTVMLPVMLLVAALIRLHTKEKAISRDERIGANGRRFMCLRFRTMPANADEILKRHLLSNACAAKEWRETRKLRNDPRVGCLGRILRKSGLDGLPQLVNVLRGEMSIVGPRSVTVSEWRQRGTHPVESLHARPGLTGLWQVCSSSAISQSRRARLDRYYARRWSFGLDCWILLRTIPALLDFDGTS
jgi:exopolysaccharide production protein ExoY